MWLSGLKSPTPRTVVQNMFVCFFDFAELSELSRVPSLKPAVRQNIALRALPATENSDLLISASWVNSSSLFLILFKYDVACSIKND